MTGYDFHPEARFDLVRRSLGAHCADNLDAADRIIADIFATLDALVPLPRQGHWRPDLTSRPCRCHAWTTQPARDGRHTQGQRVTDKVAKRSGAPHFIFC